MKKRNATALSEILANDINYIGDYTEDFQQLLFEEVLGLTSGVIYGLITTQNGASGISVSSGAIVDRTFTYGELEGASGVSLSTLPTGAVTRTDTVSAKWQELTDTPGASYVLIDVESRTQTTSNVYRRKFGAIVIEINEDTASGALTSNRMPIASITVASGGIQTITDLRTLVSISNIDAGSITLGGDLSGTAEAATVTKVQGINYSTTDPTEGQLFAYFGSQMTPISIAGDVSGSITGLVVDGLVGYSFTSGPSADLQVPTVSGSNIVWSIPSTGSITLSGDVSGSAGANTVDKLKNIPLSGAVASSGQIYVFDGTYLVPTQQIYDIAGGCVGKPSASGIVLNFVAPRTIVLPNNLSGSQFKAQTAATASGVFTIYKNGSSIGTMTVSAAGTTATFSMSGPVTLFSGDYLVVKAPNSQDSTLADIALTLKTATG